MACPRALPWAISERPVGASAACHMPQRVYMGKPRATPWVTCEILNASPERAKSTAQVSHGVAQGRALRSCDLSKHRGFKPMFRRIIFRHASSPKGAKGESPGQHPGLGSETLNASPERATCNATITRPDSCTCCIFHKKPRNGSIRFFAG
jgi:hypothetical protein